MIGTFSSAALLSYLGYEKARAVLMEMTSPERFRLAIDAAIEEVHNEDVSSAIKTVFSHLEHCDAGDAGNLWCSDFDWADEIAILSDRQLARVISYLSSDEAATVLERLAHRCCFIAEECSRLNTLDHFGAVLSELNAELRDEILDSISRINLEVANQLQIRFNGFIDILDLEYDELAAMLGGGPVEEIANALIASGHNFA